MRLREHSFWLGQIAQNVSCSQKIPLSVSKDPSLSDSHKKRQSAFVLKEKTLAKLMFSSGYLHCLQESRQAAVKHFTNVCRRQDGVA
jgi:hypothetical protein